MSRKGQKHGTGLCDTCGIVISIYALNCKDHRSKVKNKISKMKIAKEFLERGLISNHNRISMISNGA